MTVTDIVTMIVVFLSEAITTGLELARNWFVNSGDSVFVQYMLQAVRYYLDWIGSMKLNWYVAIGVIVGLTSSVIRRLNVGGIETQYTRAFVDGLFWPILLPAKFIFLYVDNMICGWWYRVPQPVEVKQDVSMHPSPATLMAYGTGHVVGPPSDPIAEHLERCSDCRHIFSNLKKNEVK